jgi:ribosome biogenesis GTPase
LFVLPGGGLLIDVPGIRELQLWGTEEDLAENFDDITHLIAQCKYATCQHNSEEGCAIQEALRNGSLEAAHYASYMKMRVELESLSQKNVVRQRHDNKRSRKNMERQAEDLRREDYT